MPKSRTVHIAGKQIFTRGLAHNFWLDLYYLSMTAHWWWFWSGCALFFVIINSVFAGLYLLDPSAIAHARPGHFMDALFFSIETLSTVGYGDMYPQGFYGRMLSTMEIFVGMSFIAIMTGMVFARFARPGAQIVFAKYPVIATHNGKPALMLRMANARHSDISDAKVKLWLVKVEKTMEGVYFRHFYPLPLLHNENPLFTLSWTLCHVIDEASPIHQKTAASLKEEDASLIVSLNGLDENAAQDLHRRKIYTHTDIRWNHQYAVITNLDEAGQTHIDYRKFHDVEPVKL